MNEISTTQAGEASFRDVRIIHYNSRYLSAWISSVGMSTSSLLTRIMIGLIVSSVILAFWKYMIMQDFVIVDDVEPESAEQIDL